MKPNFEIKTLCFNEAIENFLIMDLLLLTYNGDHMICESNPVFLKVIIFL